MQQKVGTEVARTRSGEEDPMKLCTTEEGRIESDLAPCITMVGSKEEDTAATTKKEGATKRKAAAGSSKGKKTATDPPGDKDAADVAIATADAEEWIPGQLLERPQHYVGWIMSQKRHVLEEEPDEYYARMMNDKDRPEIFTPEFLEEDRQLMRDLAERYRNTGDLLEEFQEWVRVQLETKGRVLVDETYLANRAELRQAFAEEFGDLWQ